MTDDETSKGRFFGKCFINLPMKGTSKSALGSLSNSALGLLSMKCIKMSRTSLQTIIVNIIVNYPEIYIYLSIYLSIIQRATLEETCDL